MRVSVEINDEMAKAIKLYMTKAETEESLEQLIQQGAEKAADKAFVKYVPKPIRDYYKLWISSRRKDHEKNSDTCSGNCPAIVKLWQLRLIFFRKSER